MREEGSDRSLAAEQRTTTKTILVVEDDEDIHEFIALLIATATDYHYHLVPDASQAVHFVQRGKPDLFIVDYQLTGMNGLEAIPALLVTAVKLETLRPEIEKRQITAFEKPFDLDAFLLTFQRLVGDP